ncbi:uncharacterized protein [Penaeus vannamei]|uniref:uncharacterized protein n=1 Tax=Penaeus vannamei TaxID=6689 RepID=UPI00387F72C2
MVVSTVPWVLLMLATRTLPTSATFLFIETGRFGAFMQTEAKALQDSDMYKAVDVSSVCECRTLCTVHLRCVSASAVPAGSSFRCRLSDKGPADSALLDDPSATYFYWPNRLAGFFHGVMADGLVYWEPEAWVSHSEAVATCNAVPEHRLAVFKTTSQLDVMKTLLSHAGGYGARVKMMIKMMIEQLEVNV